MITTKLCKCGCGTEIDAYDKRGRELFCVKGHQRRGYRKDPQRTVPCACGCCELIVKYNNGKRRYYKQGHQNLGRKKSLENRKKCSEIHKKRGIKPPIQTNMKGNKHWNWKGGISTVNNELRRNSNHKLFSKAVLKKDVYTCFLCTQRGPTKDNKLEAHHLLSWAEYPKYRFEILNGICLCQKCHKKVPRRLKK